VGKGNDPNCQAAGASTAMLVADTIEHHWAQPAGPEATREELDAYLDRRPGWRADPDARAKCHAQRNDPKMLGATMYPSRRALEAMLAYLKGMDAGEYAAMMRDRPWLELATEALESPYNGGYGDADYLARSVEINTRIKETESDDILAAARAGRAEPDDRFGKPVPPELKEAWGKLGPGTRSGRIEDYTRAELRKLLGFLERDCKHLSDDDLRSMVLDAGLAPQWKGSPGHAQLALDYALSSSYMPSRIVKNFRRAMREPYAKLAKRAGVDRDEVSDLERFDRLAARNPLLAVHGMSQVPDRRLRDYLGGTLDRDPAERQTVAADVKAVTPLELTFKDAFDGFTGSLPGSTNVTAIRSGLGGHRGCWGVYDPGTGEVFIHNSLVKLIDKAKRGEVEKERVADAVSTIAHELLHAQEGRDEGNRNSGIKKNTTIQHTVVEGGIEALARLHSQDLAERMNLWDPADGALMEHARSNSYRREVETVVAVMAACHGELSLDDLRAGAYQQPNRLSDQAQRQMLDLYTREGASGRIEWMTGRIAQRTGQDEEVVRGKLRKVLIECKRDRYQHRRRVETVDDRQVIRYVAPDNISEQLADLMTDLT